MKALHGYHNKDANSEGIHNNYAILADPKYEPFIITNEEVFIVQHERLLRFIQHYRAQQQFATLKRWLCTLLLLAGLFPMTLLGASLAGAYALPPQSLISKLATFLFWLALLAATVLWHDLAVSNNTEKRLPAYEPLDADLEKKLRNGSVDFTQFFTREPFDYLHPLTKSVIFEAITLNKDGTATFNSLHLFQLLLKTKQAKLILARLGMEENLVDDFNEALINEQTVPSYNVFAMHSFICYGLEQAILTNSHVVYPEHILLALFKMYPVLQRLLEKERVTVNLVQDIIEWYMMEDEYVSSVNPFNLNLPYVRKGGVADAWIYGYTFYLDQVSVNVSKTIAQNGGVFGIGHQSEMQALVNVLQRDSSAKSLLVGEPGSGSTSIVWGLAQRILRGNVPPTLKNRRIMQLDINKLVSLGNRTKGGMAAVMDTLGKELKRSGNIILFIDEFAEVVKTKGKDKSPVSDYLVPYIIESSSPVIGTMSFNDYQKHVAKKSSLSNVFEQIEVAEPSLDDTMTILTTKITGIEHKFDLFVTFPALQAIVDLTAKYMPSQRFPKKATLTLEQAAVVAQNQNKKILDVSVIKETISGQTNIPITEVASEETEKLLNLETEIRQHYINQTHAVRAIVQALQRARIGIRDPRKPIAVFLFLGPTGVGKTYLSRLIGDLYFGHKHQMIRVDMPQFKSTDQVKELLNKLEQVKLNPFTVVLLDEFEKANPDVFDIFLRIFDEGSFVNDQNQEISFQNTIIVATSNIGSDILLSSLTDNQGIVEEQFQLAQQQILNDLPKYLRPELINRFDQIIVFKPISLDNLLHITTMLLEALRGRLAEQGIKLLWRDELVAEIAKRAYNPGLGARPVKRYLQDHAEAKIAEYVLQYQQKNGRKPESITL